jgi:hypothetical protein
VADLLEAIIEHITDNAPFDEIHVGEVIPQEIEVPYVWLMRSGDVFDDELCHPPSVIAVTLDVEVVSDDIDEARELTRDLKTLLRNTELHEVQFTNDDGEAQTVHAFHVEDHDDTYLPRNIDQDERLHLGTFNLTVSLGELV